MLVAYIIPGLMQLILGFSWTGPILLWTFPNPPAQQQQVQARQLSIKRYVVSSPVDYDRPVIACRSTATGRIQTMQ